jgi:hypothetical protein
MHKPRYSPRNETRAFPPPSPSCLPVGAHLRSEKLSQKSLDTRASHYTKEPVLQDSHTVAVCLCCSWGTTGSRVCLESGNGKETAHERGTRFLVPETSSGIMAHANRLPHTHPALKHRLSCAPPSPDRNKKMIPRRASLMQTTLSKSILLGLLQTAVLSLCLCGCAFDVSHVKQTPAAFTSASDSPSFLLIREVKARLGTGFPTILRANTTWNQVGATEAGKVYATKDQVVKVEASNIYEAYIVVSNNCLTGFYLPVEKTVTPLSHALPLEIQNKP